MPTGATSSRRRPRRETVLRRLERVHAAEHHRRNVAPDPLSFVYRYERGVDAEVVALIASSLAYGRVQQIHASVENVLARLGPTPAKFLAGSTRAVLSRTLRGFKHRFTSSLDLTDMLASAAVAIDRHGSLGACFRAGHRPSDEDILPAASTFVGALSAGRPRRGFSLLPRPEDGSACKRLNLFLRWMIRRDAIDPGLFALDAAHQLVIPLDTHLYRAGRMLGFTRRATPDLRTALEVTRGFRSLAPDDPVRFDFIVTRLGVTGRLEPVLEGGRYRPPRTDSTGESQLPGPR